MLKEKHTRLIHTLWEFSSFVNAQKLAGKLGISVRTVKTYIYEINDLHPGLIESSNHGYCLDIKKAEDIFSSIDTRVHIPQTSNERVTYIINSLISSHRDATLDIFDLAEELYISHSTLKKDLHAAKKTIHKHDLKLYLQSGKLRILGLEKNKRKLLSSILYKESNVNFVNSKAIQNAFREIDVDFLKATVLETFDKYHYFINDYSLVNLVLHIAISLNRIQNGNMNTQPITSYPPALNHEYQLAREVATKLEQYYDLTYSEAEIYEMMLLIISRATTIDYKRITSNNLVDFIGTECMELVSDLITPIENFYYIDLTEPEFYIRFALHIRNLLIRTKNNYHSKNPLADGIRSSCPLIYDVSVFMANIIKTKTGITINDDEIAYITFHLGSTLGAQKDLHGKISAVLYCPNYYDMNSRLANTINHHFSSELFITNILTDESDFDDVASSDLVISTIPCSRIMKTPVLLINIFFSDRDIPALQNKILEIKRLKRRTSFEYHLKKLIVEGFFEKTNFLSTVEETIPYMVDKMAAKDYVDGSFEKQIWEREYLSSTAFNSFAIPHSMRMRAKKTGINIIVSDTPISWFDRPVHLVLMLSINENERNIFHEIFDPLTMILSEPENIQKLIRCRNYTECINLLVSLFK